MPDLRDRFVDNNLPHAPYPGDVAWDKNDPGFHHYDVLTKICDTSQNGCSLGNMQKGVLPLFSYPSEQLAPTPASLDGRPVVVYGPNPVNPLSSTSDPEDYTMPAGRVVQTQTVDGGIKNTTLKDHIFSWGEITRTAIQKDDGIYIMTHGIGVNRNSTLGSLNDKMGPEIFKTLDQQAKKYWNENYGKR